VILLYFKLILWYILQLMLKEILSVTELGRKLKLSAD